ncbi:hybrid sensor histidine kinase/response regulator [Desulfopila aestuarii]|nr:ABC transporter substrate binding protein [Desulfopila aestuarii]
MEADEQQNVLVIHSYHKEMQWVDEVEQAIEQTLLANRGTSIDIHVEYMDSKRFSDTNYNKLLTAVWDYKYGENRPDVLIVCDDNALNLILSLRDEIFPGIPIVFCGINYYDPAVFSKLDNITGVVEAFDLPGTLNIIKKLLPDQRNLFIINDSTLTGVANKRRIEEIAYLFSDHFTFTYSGNLSIGDLQNAIRTLPNSSVILLMTFNRDAEGQTFRYRDAIQAIRSSSSRPIFGVWSFYLGRGLLGGSLVNGESQGKTAAELALKILNGSPAASLPVVNESPNLPMFDYKELKRFSISSSLLPAGSTIINTPDNLWYRHKHQILGVFALFVTQLFIIALLMKSNRQRQESERKLRKSRQDLSVTLEAIGEAVISVDTDFRIVNANAQAGRLFNLTIAQMQNRPLPELFSESDPVHGHALADFVRKYCKAGVAQDFPEDTVYTPPTQSQRYLSGSCSPIRDPQGAILGAVLVCRDITEKRTMESMLTQSRKMEAIGQLAGGVAHDFNNLLTGISGFAELLTIKLPNGSMEQQNANRILQAAGRAADLTRKMLSFARKGKVMSSPVDCHQSLQATIDLLSHSIDKSVTITSLFQAQDSVIIGDPTQLENIFLNLAINSADAMPDGGRLTIVTENVEVIASEQCAFGEVILPGTYFRVRFIDTGCGIDETIQEKIFEPFFTTKDQGKGTGLGLAAVFGSMKEHDGRIQLISEVGVGTEFILSFPLSHGQQSETAREIDTPAGEGTTVLVIDDERLILASAKGLLTELGYSVLLAEGATAGIETYRRYHQEIDLVLLDMIMPEMNGTTCFKKLLDINKNVCALICSGFTKTEKFTDAEKLGVRGYIQKPYSASELSNAIRNALHPVSR